jgi:hypothetical protein
VLPSIEPIRFKLRVPHAEFADYVRFYQLLATPFARKKARTQMFMGLGIGAVMGALLLFAALHWRLWGTLEVGAGSGDGVIFLEGISLCVGVLAVLGLGFGLAWYDRRLVSKRVLGNMYATSRREPSDWTLLIGEAGIQAEFHGSVALVPWRATTSLREGVTATFLYFNGGLNGLIITNEAFADPSERTACLAFIKSKVPAPMPTSQPPEPAS